MEVSRLVEKDPSLSGKILNLVNSAYYGLPQKIKSIHHSISYLGTGTLKNIAISSSILHAFSPPSGNNLFNLKTFWWHSLRCAVFARFIAREIKYNNPEEAFLTGLLHDIGRLVLWVNYPKEYSELLANYSGRSDLLLAGEIRQGITHCEIGAWMLNRWNLPPFVVDAVLYHHEPAKRIKSALPLVQIIWVANALSQQPGSAQVKDRDLEFAEGLCGLSSSQVRTFFSRVDQEVGDVAGLLGIEIDVPGESEVSVSEKDTKKQEELNSEVRDSSLVLGTVQNLMEARDEDDILRQISQGFGILFDLKDIFFFRYDMEKNCLMGKAVKENEKSDAIGDLIISMENRRSLLISSLLEGKALELFSEQTDVDTALIDVQIIRFVGKEGVLCLPMLAYGEYVGVIVLGLNQIEFSHLSKKNKLLNIFSRQAALSLHADQLRKAPLKKIQTERAGASSVIARKVVHEVNNPLGIIKNYLKILGIKLSAQNIAQDEIGIISKEIDRISHILRTLTTFSENEVRPTEPVDINKLLNDIVKITKDSLRKNSGIEVHLDLNDSLPRVMSDEDRLKQVFINLIKNAAEAMEGGNLTLGTRYLSSHLDDKSAGPQTETQGYVEIIIEDDGPGISDEILPRLFDPFVTSKGKGHSGLGLSIAHNLVEALNGTLICESEMGKGTRFIICLPVSHGSSNT